MDYVPPVDITFGELLRALITADWELAPSERRRNRIAFIDAFRYLRNRITAFAALPVASLDRASLRARLVEIGHSDGASSPRNSAA